jgi:tetratricopeptide (TPR) repeat protein/DNA-binding CsgD family transcriptional regulator
MGLPVIGTKWLLILGFLISLSNGFCQNELEHNPFALNADLIHEFGLRIEKTVQESERYLKTDLKKALEFALKSVELSDAYPGDTYFFDTRNNLAKVCFYTAMYPQALTHWFSCLNYAEEKANEALIAKSCFNLSALCITIQEYDYAVYYLKRAEPYFVEQAKEDASSGASAMVLIYNNLAIVLAKKGYSSEGEYYFVKALEIIELNNLYQERIILYNAYTTFLLEQGNYSKAKQLVEETLQLNQVYQNRQTEATALIKLARIYGKQGDKDKMYTILKSGNEIAVSINAMTLMKEYVEDLFKYEKEAGNLRSALRFAEIRDSITWEEQLNEAKRAILLEDLKTVHSYYTTKISKLRRKKTSDTSTAVLFILLTLSGVLIPLIVYMRNSGSAFPGRQIPVTTLKELEKANNELKEEVRNKEKELITLMLNEMRRKEAIKTMMNAAELQNHDDPQLKIENKDQIIKKIERIFNSTSNDEFELRFKEVDEEFYKKLTERFPDLTLNERKLCAFLNLDMSTKEIIQYTGQSLRAVEIARTRLRKKLGISGSDVALNTFIKSI